MRLAIEDGEDAGLPDEELEKKREWLEEEVVNNMAYLLSFMSTGTNSDA